MVKNVIACLSAAIFLSAGLGATEYSYPVFTASYGKAPAIDGKINEAEWSDASSYSGFMNTCPLGEELRSFPLHFLVPTQTKLWLKWDDEKLYMAFQCERIPGVDITATISAGERDKNLTKEDCMEFFFVPAKGGANGGRNFFFVGNSKGAIFDGINKDENFKQWNGAWNGDWTYATSVDETY